MNSKLLKKKSALIFSAVFAILIVGCVFLNAFLVKAAIMLIHQPQTRSLRMNPKSREKRQTTVLYITF